VKAVSHAADIHRRQGADVDAGLWRVGHPHHHGRQVGDTAQRDTAEVRAAGVAMVGRVQVGPGVADQGEPVNGELGAGGVVLPRGFPRQVRGDLRPRQPGIGDHAGPDHVAEFDQPAARGRPATDVVRRPAARSLVRFGDDLDVAELDRVRHQQAQRGHEQRGNRGLVDLRRGNVHPEPVSGQVAAVAEPDGSVKGRTVFGHRTCSAVGADEREA
jgi:hypothetical protein